MRSSKGDLTYIEEALQEYRAVLIETTQRGDGVMLSSIVHERGIDRPVTELDHNAYQIRKTGHLCSVSFEDCPEKIITEWLHR
jgi:hypothetical protein